MCVAIYKKAGAAITDEVFDNCYRNNKDGCGFSYLKPKGKGHELKVYKTLSYATFKKAYRKQEAKYPNSPMLVHFRAMSKGAVNMNNCHPFLIDSKHAFIHNGTIGKAPDDTAGNKSDTVMFNETTLQLLPKGWWGNPVVKTLIENYIGVSRLVMMDNKGECHIYNEKAGHWVGEVWYSNDQYKTPYIYQQKKKTTHCNNCHNQGKTTHQDSYNNSNYGDDNEYDENVDYTKFCNAESAFHGQSRWNETTEKYEKYDFDNERWVRLNAWNDEYLLRLKPLASDNAPAPINYQLTMDEISLAAANAGVPKKQREFSLVLTDQDRVPEKVAFARCEFCWRPDYEDSLLVTNLIDSDVSYELCEECNYNMRQHDMIDETK